MERRQAFVESTLNETVSTAFDWVGYIEYVKTELSEFVNITCKNGYKYRVNIIGDSLGAIIEDVVRECLRH